jgi:hypothetical protein
MKTEKIIELFNPCSEGEIYLRKYKTLKTAWKHCKRGDWMLWLAAKLNVDQRLLVGAVGRCTATVKHLMTDRRSLDALNACERFAAGEIGLSEMRVYVNAAAAAADAAAYAAYAAAYAAAANAYAAANASASAAYAAVNTSASAAYAAAYAAYAAAYAAANANASAAYAAVNAAAASSRKQTVDICRDTLTDAVMDAALSAAERGGK